MSCQDTIRSSPEVLQKGIAVIAGVDGYRAAFTLSELVNRNDQEEMLVIDRKDEQGSGRFSLFPAADFFSDRAIKSVMEINLLIPVGGSKWAIVVHGGAGVITRDRMTPETRGRIPKDDKGSDRYRRRYPRPRRYGPRCR